MEPGSSPRIVTSKRKIIYRESVWSVHEFQIWSGDQIGCAVVLKMTDSLLVWIGSAAERRLGDVALGMPGGPKKQAVSTTLLEGESPAAPTALRLATALRRPVFACRALPVDRFNGLLLERALADEIRRFPEKFHS